VTRTPIALLAATILIMAVASGAAAQTPEPEGCGLSPLTLPLFDATPVDQVTPPAFEPVSEGDALVEEIEGAVTTIMACVSTGDPASAWAVFTPRYLAEQFADPAATYLPQFEQSLAEGVSIPVPFEVLGVSDVTVLDDGRVSVAVEYTNGVSTFRDTLILARIDGIWLIDEIAALDPER